VIVANHARGEIDWGEQRGGGKGGGRGRQARSRGEEYQTGDKNEEERNNWSRGIGPREGEERKRQPDATRKESKAVAGKSPRGANNSSLLGGRHYAYAGPAKRRNEVVHALTPRSEKGSKK